MVMSAVSFTSTAHSQTVVIGGSGALPVQVNLGAINPQPTFIAPLNNAYQSNIVASQSKNNFSTSSRIIYGNEVITLTPPGSRPKKKKIVSVKKKPVATKVKVATKTAAPKTVVTKPKPEVKVSKVVPPVKMAVPKVDPTPAKAEAMPSPAPVIAKKEPVVPVKPVALVEKPVVIAKSKKAAPVKTEKTVAKIVVPKAVTPAEAPKATKKPEPEMQVAAIAPETKIEPAVEKSGSANQIFFKPEQSKLPGNAISKLKELANTLKSNDERIQLFAYADANSSSAARRLSLGRALVVRSKLMELGVPNNKIEVRALGKPKDGSPADRVDLNLITR